MRKQVDGLSIMIQTVLKLDPFEPSLFVFCNKGKNRLKILHFDHGFWLYYHRLEKGKFKWPDKEGLFNISFEELKWFINGHELRLETRKFESIKKLDLY
jgi:transposase